VSTLLFKTLNDIKNAIYSTEALSGSILPNSYYRMYKAQNKNGIKISIDGHGSDEMLGGYWWLIDAAAKNHSKFSFRFYQLLEQQRLMNRTSFKRFYLKRILERFPYLKSLVKNYLNTPNHNYINFFLNPEIIENHTVIFPSLPSEWSQLQKEIYKSFHYTILPPTIRNVDIVSMAYGIESRLPFMDYRLISFIFSLPDTSKIEQGFSKLILRHAMKDRLPNKIAWRKDKIPFSDLSSVYTLRNELREYIEDLLSGDNPFPELISFSNMHDFYNKNILASDAFIGKLSLFCRCFNAIVLAKSFREQLESKLLDVEPSIAMANSA
jgi:asparagine synthase (glutamine-hydrolysing)